MTLKDKLPDRLKCSPLLTMESDSDIETIAETHREPFRFRWGLL